MSWLFTCRSLLTGPTPPEKPAKSGGHAVFLPLVAHGVEGQAPFADAPLVEVDGGHALSQLARDGRCSRRRREDDLDERDAARGLAPEDDRLHAWSPGQGHGKPSASFAPLALILGLLRHEHVEGRHRARDLFLADLEPAPETVPRHAVEGLVHELLGRRPRGGRHVHVELLEKGGGHEVPPAEKESARLRTAERLAAAHGHEVRALGDEALQVVQGRYLVGGVDDDGQLMAVGHLGERAQIGPHALHGHVGEGHRARSDDRLDLLRLHLAHPDAERAIEQADFDETRAGDFEGLVVRVPVVTADDHLASRLVGVARHAVHPRDVEAGDAGAGGEGERPEGARGDEPRLGSSMVGDDPAGRFLQLVDGHRAPCRLGHRLHRLRAHQRAAEPRQRSRGVDDGPDTQPIVDGHHTFLLYRARSTASAMSSRTALYTSAARPSTEATHSLC